MFNDSGRDSGCDSGWVRPSLAPSFDASVVALWTPFCLDDSRLVVERIGLFLSRVEVLLFPVTLIPRDS